MKAVLVGGLTPLPLSDLKTPNWRFTDKFETATWYSTREYDGPGNGETLLFYVDDWGAPDGPLHLEYDVAEDGRGLLRDRSLAVTHDASAKHLLRDHAQSFVQAFGWALLFWGVLWMTLQVGMERRRRGKTKNASVPAGTEASGSL
jgi:hypothetical protein